MRRRAARIMERGASFPLPGSRSSGVGAVVSTARRREVVVPREPGINIPVAIVPMPEASKPVAGG